MKAKKLERGQILVLIALGFVAFMGFVALGIDGSRVFYERRRAQNAADAAAYAGAAYVGEQIKDVESSAFSCSSWNTGSYDWSNSMTKAIARSGENGFSIDTDLSDKTGVELTCVNGAEKYIDVHVRITHESPTYFVHFVYPAPVISTVDAVVRVRPLATFAGGTAILALKDTCTPLEGDRTDGGAVFTGDANIVVKGGSIHSNACLNAHGSPPGSQVTAENGEITFSTDYTNNGDKLVNPTPSLGGPIYVEANFPLACPETKPGDAINVAPPGNVPITTINPYPATYGDVIIPDNRRVNMQPGLYCIYGTVNVTSGGLLEDGVTQGGLFGNGVTIYMPPTAGAFYIAGEAHVELSAPPSGCENDSPSCSPAIGGMLLWYMPDLDLGPNPPIQVTMAGDSSSNYIGTVYAPDNTVDVGGGGSTLSTIGAQIIAETVYVHGNSDLTIVYDPNYSPEQPALLNLER